MEGDEGGTDGAAGSSAAHGATVGGEVALAAERSAVDGGVAGRKRERGVVSSEMAVKRFVAFVGGVQVSRVVMVSGVHVIAGRKRTRNGEDGHEAAEADGVVRQRDERSERHARRERRRRIAEASAAESTTRSDEGSRGTPEVWCEEATADDGRDEGAGGLGDRTGVG